ncbi:MAG: Voltage-gated ClC-type chloride channel ClcB [Phycisphaerae bacterium]|nr:Voltage-gated ClC-type chloride channel ClcB [Phycisphaerae bacterium]
MQVRIKIISIIHHIQQWLRFSRPATRWARLFVVAVVVGILSGLAAAVLKGGLDWGSRHIIGTLVDPGRAGGGSFHWGLLLLPTLGCLASGLIVYRWFREPWGHGTDILVYAFHHRGGVLPLRGPSVKATAVLGVISCGGSAGPEGPMAAWGAAIGSAVGKWFGLTPRERRIMLVAGCGAGIGAIFQCPLGGALFAAGVLYREPDFETDALVPAFFASVCGYSTVLLCLGQSPHLLQQVDQLVFSSPWELIPYVLLAPICALACLLLNWCLQWIERHLVGRLRKRLPLWAIPAVGGALTGLIACIFPQVMDGQYHFLQRILDGELFTPLDQPMWRWALFFGAVAIAKALATACTVGSGASGGVLGPSVFIGGAAGAMVGAFVEALAPNLVDVSVRQALIPVGMAGVLAAAMRTPLAAIVMVTEMTGSFGLITPSMLVCVSAYLLGRRWGLNHEQLRNMSASPAHAGDAIVHLLESWSVGELMQRTWEQTVPPSAGPAELIALAKPGTQPLFAVVEKGRLLGVIHLTDLERVMSEPGLSNWIIAVDLMQEQYVSVTSEDDAYYAISRMAQVKHSSLPVISSDYQGRFEGMITRHAIQQALQQRLGDLREHLLAEHDALTLVDEADDFQRLVRGIAEAPPYRLLRQTVPMEALGSSLRELDFRRAFGVQVVAIEQADGTIECPPNPDHPLLPTQHLVALELQHKDPPRSDP